ncbi:MAG: 3-phosphoshikimate 1-carboxyvinyltransferase [Oscillospiraceae bacterium]|nr:3-phosphoshikimate 1-carboxyvinyltransferase [Oscillospiraceae bacterium]
MNVKIIPSRLKGTVSAPSSKSLSHRMIIAAALGSGVSTVTNVTDSEDIKATADAMKSLGAQIGHEGTTYRIKGIFSADNNDISGRDAVHIDCGESGSTLRFIIPIAAALGRTSVFSGRGKLPCRPITPYLREFPKHGVHFDYNDTMPFTLSGRLTAGEYELEGDISSQFITGLLFALPLCEGDSIIRLTSPLQSKPYADMTAEALKLFGITVSETGGKNDLAYIIKGGQKYTSADTSVEGDYSQAAFFFTANAIGSSITVNNLKENSFQGDKAIIDIIDRMGEGMEPFTVDVGDIPDLVPTLAVLGCFTNGVSRIVNAARLRIKESDRLTAVANALNAIGGRVEAGEDSLTIYPIKQFTGGTVDACNDHRIAMAAAVASTRSEAPVTIIGADAVNKSYPGFFRDFVDLGGDVIVNDKDFQTSPAHS